MIPLPYIATNSQSQFAAAFRDRFGRATFFVEVRNVVGMSSPGVANACKKELLQMREFCIGWRGGFGAGRIHLMSEFKKKLDEATENIIAQRSATK